MAERDNDLVLPFDDRRDSPMRFGPEELRELHRRGWLLGYLAERHSIDIGGAVKKRAPGKTTAAILEWLRRNGPVRDADGRATSVVAAALGFTQAATIQALKKLDDQGDIVRVINGKRCLVIAIPGTEGVPAVPARTLVAAPEPPAHPGALEVEAGFDWTCQRCADGAPRACAMHVEPEALRARDGHAPVNETAKKRRAKSLADYPSTQRRVDVELDADNIADGRAPALAVRAEPTPSPAPVQVMEMTVGPPLPAWVHWALANAAAEHDELTDLQGQFAAVVDENARFRSEVIALRELVGNLRAQIALLRGGDIERIA